MPNIVYALTNPAMPGMVKIGLTDRDVQRRMSDLYGTGVPLPFECVIAKQIEGRDAAEIENALHTAFGPYRINSSREFFEIDPEQVEVLLNVMPGEDVTPRVSDREAQLPPDDRDAIKRLSQTSEQEFLDSLDENGIRVFERVLPLGKQDGMRIKWWTKGFSLRAVSNGEWIVVCYGYPPNCKYGQSIHPSFYSLKEKSSIPQAVIDGLKRDAQATNLFVQAGDSGDRLRCPIDRRLEDAELATLTGWLESVVNRIREFENTTHETDVPADDLPG